MSALGVMGVTQITPMNLLTRIGIGATAALLLALPLNVVTLVSIVVTVGIVALVNFDYSRSPALLPVRG